MLNILDDAVDLVKSLFVQDADFLGQMPGAGVMDQKLRLFAFLDQRLTKVSFIHCIPVYLVQLTAAIVEVGGIAAGIPVRESPAYPVLICPVYSRFHIHLYVNDWALTSLLRDNGVRSWNTITPVKLTLQDLTPCSLLERESAYFEGGIGDGY